MMHDCPGCYRAGTALRDGSQKAPALGVGVHGLESYMGSDSAGGARVMIRGTRTDVCGAGQDAEAGGVGRTGLIRIGKCAVLRGESGRD